MKIIGITGQVGAGKSTVLEYLKDNFHAFVLEADKVGHLLMEPGQSCYEKVIQLLGKEIVGTDGRIERKLVAQKVFSDDELLRRQEAIIHPAVKRYVMDAIEKQRKAGTQVFVLEAALLLEEHYDAICDDLWYIYVSEEVREQRLMKSRGYTREKIKEILSQQLTEEEFRRKCSYVIDNNGSSFATYEQIDRRMKLYEFM